MDVDAAALASGFADSMINTGFRRHIDLLVDNEGERPSDKDVAAAKQMLGKNTEERWFNVSGLGYDKNWMWVLGYK